MTEKPDMVDMTDDELTDLAVLAFRRGLADGRVKSKTITGDYLMSVVIPPVSCRRGHQAKLRQIYGAAFDMAQMVERIRADEKEKG